MLFPGHINEVLRIQFELSKNRFKMLNLIMMMVMVVVVVTMEIMVEEMAAMVVVVMMVMVEVMRVDL